MRRYLVVILMIFALVGITNIPHTAQAMEQDIAVVNVKRVMAEAKAALSARDQLEAKKKEFKSQSEATSKKLNEENQELSKQRTVLSKEAFEQKLKEFRTKAAEAQRGVMEKQQKLNKAYQSALSEFNTKILAIVEGMAKERGLKLVLASGQTIYADESLDITGEVLTRLNRELPSIAVKF